jgi:hypothetical protein
MAFLNIWISRITREGLGEAVLRSAYLFIWLVCSTAFNNGWTNVWPAIIYRPSEFLSTCQPFRKSYC